MVDNDTKYVNLFLEPLRKCADYTPKMGQGKSGVDLRQFQTIYGGDLLYSCIGFDSPMMYAAHKASGGMTSLYRQLGIGCERLFRTMIQDTCRLDDSQSTWSYMVESPGGQRTLSLDARIDIGDLGDPTLARRFSEWLEGYRAKLDVQTEIRGAVFEVRQGYKSKDSKRQNADLANAATAYTQRYLPILTGMSTQLDLDLRYRYEGRKMGVLSGMANSEDSLASVFAFSREVLGYDLEGFFARNAGQLRSEVVAILEALLEPS
jgi:hypothetical protein